MGAGAIVLGFGGLGGFAGLFRKQKSYGTGQPIMNYVDLVSNLATSGKWEIIQHSVNGVLKDNICPVMPVHAALLRNGHVLFLAGSQNDRQGYNHHCLLASQGVWVFRALQIHICLSHFQNPFQKSNTVRCVMDDGIQHS